MKTSWDADYIWRKSGRNAHKWMRAKQDEFERATGVRWTYYTAHGQIKFAPVCEGRVSNERMADFIAEFGEEKLAEITNQLKAVYKNSPKGVFGYIGFLQLAGEAEIDLRTTIIALYYATRNRMATMTVARSGQAVAVKFYK